jgi:hypothetical protein
MTNALRQASASWTYTRINATQLQDALEVATEARNTRLKAGTTTFFRNADRRQTTIGATCACSEWHVICSEAAVLGVLGHGTGRLAQQHCLLPRAEALAATRSIRAKCREATWPKATLLHIGA